MWSWQSIRPGRTVRPAQFTISASAGKSAALRVVIALILLPSTTIVASVEGAFPVPSISRAFLRTIIASLRSLCLAKRGCCHEIDPNDTPAASLPRRGDHRSGAARLGRCRARGNTAAGAAAGAWTIARLVCPPAAAGDEFSSAHGLCERSTDRPQRRGHGVLPGFLARAIRVLGRKLPTAGGERTKHDARAERAIRDRGAAGR